MQPGAASAITAVADRQPGDVGSERGHASDRLETEQPGFARILAERVEHVAEIEPRREDFDLDFAGARRAAREPFETQIVERAPRSLVEHVAFAFAQFGQRCCRRSGYQARGETLAVAADGELVLARGTQRSGDDRRHCRVARLRFNVDQPAPDMGHLVGDRPADAPERRAVKHWHSSTVILGHDLLDLPAEQPQPRLERHRPAPQRLQCGQQRRKRRARRVVGIAAAAAGKQDIGALDAALGRPGGHDLRKPDRFCFATPEFEARHCRLEQPRGDSAAPAVPITQYDPAVRRRFGRGKCHRLPVDRMDERAITVAQFLVERRPVSTLEQEVADGEYRHAGFVAHGELSFDELARDLDSAVAPQGLIEVAVDRHPRHVQRDQHAFAVEHVRGVALAGRQHGLQHRIDQSGVDRPRVDRVDRGNPAQRLAGALGNLADALEMRAGLVAQRLDQRVEIGGRHCTGAARADCRKVERLGYGAECRDAPGGMHRPGIAMLVQPLARQAVADAVAFDRQLDDARCVGFDHQRSRE